MPWHLPLWLLTPSDRAFRRRRLELWLDTVVSCGLRIVDSSSQSAPRLKVEARARPVTVRIEEPRSHSPGIRVTAVFPGPRGFAGVSIRRLAPGTRDLETGDELFDKTFRIEGPRRLLSVLLDAEMRRLLVSVRAEIGLEISRGELRLETRDEDLSAVLPLLLEISRRLAQRVDPVQRLAENARREPEPRMRLRNLLLLAHEFAGAPGVTEALHAACSDASPQVRLRAALELGTRGRDVLVELAESLVDDACAAQAVTRLGRELPFERTRAILAGALDRRLIQTTRACLEALGKSGDPAAVDVLAKMVALHDGTMAAAAALALGATGSPAAEPPLLLALQREDTQVAAANALARTGTAAAVLPLQEAAERSPDNADLRQATRQAIAGIQSRLQGASPGQLSVAEAEAGQLSLAQSEAGQLSLASDPAGQLSLPPGGKTE
jgi:hypothetical protein